MALNPCDYACVDDTHESTRIICECPWFDARCHNCPIPVLNALPPCMVECPDDDGAYSTDQERTVDDGS